MPIAISALLLCLWLAVAWRLLQRGEPVLACLCAVIGILLALYRLRLWRARQSGDTQNDPPP
jgi:hypothetical protein